MPDGEAEYADEFIASITDALSRSPEEWARQVLEGASWPMRAFLRIGWRYFLGFPLVRDNAVLGWPIVTISDNGIVLAQSSWLMGVVLEMRTSEAGLSWATRVDYRSPLARPAWAVVRPIHRRYAPRALRRAADSAQ